MMTNQGQHFLFGPPEDFDVSNQQPINTEIFEFNQYKLLVGLGGNRDNEAGKIVDLLAFSVDILCMQKKKTHFESPIQNIPDKTDRLGEHAASKKETVGANYTRRRQRQQ